MEGESAGSRRKRKEEAKHLKRQRIEQSGGIRPRKPDASPPKSSQLDTPTPSGKAPSLPFGKQKDKHGKHGGTPGSSSSMTNASSGHRFGRVMDTVPCRNQPRLATVSIAIPGSVVANCQTRELKTQISGQIARAAAIYHVDEIIVFDDKLSKGDSSRRPFRATEPDRRRDSGAATESTTSNDTEPRSRPSDPHAFLARILQYCECPQYLRRHFFPMHPDLQFAGLLAPVDAPHHVRAEDRCPFREGVVLEKTHNKGSLVNCGVFKRPVHIDQRLQPGIRCTVQLDPNAYGRPGQLHGTVVSPTLVTQRDGTYWGYTVRMASSIKAVFDECPYEDGTYDLTIGTSERGHESVDDANFSLRKRRSSPTATSTYRHALVVFGGVAGIEECVDADESLKLAGSASSTMFDKWVNICSFQGSRTIRSEEAVLIALARLSPFLAEAACTTIAVTKENATKVDSVSVALNDEVSDESSVDE